MAALGWAWRVGRLSVHCRRRRRRADTVRQIKETSTYKYELPKGLKHISHMSHALRHQGTKSQAREHAHQRCEAGARARSRESRRGTPNAQSLSTRQRGFLRVSLLQLYFSQKATQGGGVRARPQPLTALTPTSSSPHRRPSASSGRGWPLRAPQGSARTAPQSRATGRRARSSPCRPPCRRASWAPW